MIVIGRGVCIGIFISLGTRAEDIFYFAHIGCIEESTLISIHKAVITNVLVWP